MTFARILFIFFAAACASAPPAVVAQAPYRILISNDDGVRAPGIVALAEALKAVGEITIVAPADNQTGKGHSISITDPVYVDRVVLPGGIEALGATATPASTVSLALHALLKERPHLVVSGINRGLNVGVVAYMSGTVGAAREGALNGIPSIASSMDVANGWSDYTAAAKLTAQIAALVKKQGLPPGIFLNVNIPTGVPKGIRLTTQSALRGDESWSENKNPRGRRYFWNDYREPTKDVAGTDVSAVVDGYVAVVPLKASEYDPMAAEKLKAIIK